MEITALLKTCSVIISHSLASGIIAVESNGKPYVVNVNVKNALQSYSFNDEKEAIKKSKALIESGHSIDMGMAQINSANLKKLGVGVDDIFEPCENLNAMQTVFLWGYNLPADKGLTLQEKEIAAISRYNTGSPVNGIKNGYVGKVIAARMAAMSGEKKEIIVTRENVETKANDSFVSVPDGFSKLRHTE